jgi:hypothetical protein
MSNAKPEVITRMNEQLDQLLGSKEAVQYEEQQKHNRFESIMNTQEYLTQEEYDFCFGWDKDVRNHTSYIGRYSSDSNVYLNLRVYTEHDHEMYNYDDCNN